MRLRVFCGRWGMGIVSGFSGQIFLVSVGAMRQFPHMMASVGWRAMVVGSKFGWVVGRCGVFVYLCGLDCSDAASGSP